MTDDVREWMEDMRKAAADGSLRAKIAAQPSVQELALRAKNEAAASSVMTNEVRYRDALEQIVCLLEPLYYPRTGSQGDVYETTEALRWAMNALAGLEGDAHQGPWLRTGEPTPPDYEEQRAARLDRLHAAWRATGFVEDTFEGKTIWRRGTAF